MFASVRLMLALLKESSRGILQSLQLTSLLIWVRRGLQSIYKWSFQCLICLKRILRGAQQTLYQNSVNDFGIHRSSNKDVDELVNRQ